MASLTQFLEKKLLLKVNPKKSAVARPWKRKFLGYSMTMHKAPRLKVVPESVRRLKQSLKDLFRRGRGMSIGRLLEEMTPKLRGWIAYLKLAEVKGIFEELDGWIRRRLRMVIWRQWKRPFTRAKNLMKRGLTEERAWTSAYNGRGPWWNAGGLAHERCLLRRLLRPPWARVTATRTETLTDFNVNRRDGTVRTVVWEDGSGPINRSGASYPILRKTIRRFA